MAGAGVIMTRPGQPGPTLGTRGERVVSHMRSDNDDDDDDDDEPHNNSQVND